MNRNLKSAIFLVLLTTSCAPCIKSNEKNIVKNYHHEFQKILEKNEIDDSDYCFYNPSTTAVDISKEYFLGQFDNYKAKAKFLRIPAKIRKQLAKAYYPKFIANIIGLVNSKKTSQLSSLIDLLEDQYIENKATVEKIQSAHTNIRESINLKRF